MLRASVTPDAEIWVGQRVTLYVDVLGRDGWAQVKSIRDFEVSGAHVIRTETQGVRLNESLEGQSYTGQRYELSLYPQRGGGLTVPSVPVDVEVKTWGADAEATTQRMETPLVTFDVKVPPGAEGVRGLISTTQLTAKQEWTPPPGDFMVGDAIKRTVSLEAADVSGMSFSPMAQDRIEGVGVYPEEPSVQDDSYRGTLTGKRSQTITYVFEREGSVELPTVIIQWWNLDSRQLVREELEGLALDIASNPDLLVDRAEDVPLIVGAAKRPLWVLVPVALLMALVAVFWRFREPLHARFRQWRHERRESEDAYFHRFRRSARSGDSKAALNALMRWLDRIHGGPGAARLDLFVDEFGDEQLREETAKLQRIAAASGDEHWAGSGLTRGVTDARKRWFAAQRRRVIGERTLPALNPAARSTRAKGD